MTYLLLYALFHLGCATLGHGVWFAYLQRRYLLSAAGHWREDMAFSGMLHLVFGPVALFASLACSGFAKHGLLYRPSKR